MSERQILVYVQALPVTLLGSAKTFKDLQSSEYSTSQSSKVALAKASAMGFHEVVAVGYAPVLHEALARGATSVLSVPFCDNPFEQAKSFPREGFSHVLIGENSDGPFTGASLAGALIPLLHFSFHLLRGNPTEHFPDYSILLVKDTGAIAANIDIRRIKSSVETRFEEEAVLGSSLVAEVEPSRHELLTGEPGDLTSSLSKRLKRLHIKI